MTDCPSVDWTTRPTGRLDFSIPLVCHPFTSTSLADTVQRLGVYVLWDAESAERPAYIGEGVLLQRLVTHSSDSRFSAPLDGYVGVTGPGPDLPKEFARIAEWMLIEAARRSGLPPRVNDRRGAALAVSRILGPSAVIQICVQGYHPFYPPCRPKELREPFCIRAQATGRGAVLLHP